MTKTHYEVEFRDKTVGDAWLYYGTRSHLKDARSDASSGRKQNRLPGCSNITWRIVRVTSKREVVE